MTGVQSTAANLYTQWKSLALTGDSRLLAAYGQMDSWTLGYNLFADVWLGTDVVDSFVSIRRFLPYLDIHPIRFPDIRRSR